MSEFARELTDLIANVAADADDPGSVWGQVCELGLAGIGMPEDKGGSGGSLADLVVVVRELARAGLNTPIVEASTTSYAVDSVTGGEGYDTIVVVPELDVSSKAVTANFTQVPFADRAAGLVIVTTSSVVTVPLAGSRSPWSPAATSPTCPAHG